MSSDRVEFAGSGGEKLAASVELPEAGSPRAYALFAHCFTCSRNLKAVVNISRALAERGIGVLRFDFTGLGESEGEFAETNFSSNVDDLLAAAAFMSDRYAAPELLVGHSLGGAAVLRAAAELESVRTVATIGAPADPAHVEHLLSGSLEEIERTGEAEVDIGGRKFRIRKQFLDDLEEGCSAQALGALDAALMICHSPVDPIVGIENAERIYRATKHPKSFLSLDSADHLLTDEADSGYVGAVLAAWADRYLSGEAGESTTGERTEPERPDGDVAADAEGAPAGTVITRTGPEGFRTVIRAGRHRLVADEPASAGGTDEGPDPYGLLLAALGACTSMTLRMYADRKGWPLEEARTRLVHRREHARDCEDCEKGSRIDVIERIVEVEGELDDEQRERLLEIAERCPVHRTLERGPRIDTRPG